MGSQPQQTYLIVGCGIFGASTALHLKKSQPEIRVILIDRSATPCPSAASHDLSKILRADYDDLLYMKLALEAMEEWRTNIIFSPYYYESGILIADTIGWGKGCLKNYAALNVSVQAEMLPLENVLERFPVFKQTKWDGAKECYFNPASGWAEGDKALASCLDAAKELGVEFQQCEVAKILTGGDRHDQSIGVIASDGTILHADKVVLCTGAYTDRLLLDSFPDAEELHANGRLIAAGAVSCSAVFDASDNHLLQGSPVLINSLPHTLGDSIPPLKDGRLKFNHENSFTNKTIHQPSGKTISIPPPKESQSTWGHDLPQQLKDEANQVMRNTYGDTLKELKVDEFRMCWDAVTPDQNWIISPHPGVQNLYIATGGSFHTWKFLPNIGKYVTRMLCGELDHEMTQRWAWDRKTEDSACPLYFPSRDLKDLY